MDDDEVEPMETKSCVPPPSTAVKEKRKDTLNRVNECGDSVEASDEAKIDPPSKEVVVEADPIEKKKNVVGELLFLNINYQIFLTVLFIFPCRLLYFHDWEFVVINSQRISGQKLLLPGVLNHRMAKSLVLLFPLLILPLLLREPRRDHPHDLRRLKTPLKCGLPLLVCIALVGQRLFLNTSRRNLGNYLY